MKKKIAIIAGIVAAAAIVGGALWFFLGRDSAGNSTEVVYVSKLSTVLNQGTLGMPNRFSGVVEPQQTYEVQLQPDKTVKEVLVEKGREVVAGTPLFVYDTEQAQSDLSQAQLDLDRISNDIDNLYSQIKTLEKEKKAAGEEEKLNYTTQIQTAQNDIKKNEYEIKSKKIEIEKLKDSIQNATVKSEIAGVVKSINQGGGSQDMYGGSSESNAFITILETGQFRVKGTVNEQNIFSVTEGAPVIIRSRVNDSTWTGTLGKVDTENAQNSSSGGMYYGFSSNQESQSSNYPFYVSLDSADGLMLGQHVYIELNMGQEDEKIGIWLPEYLISDIDSEPYVWADDGNGKLVKKSVALGQYDADLMEYEIADGLEMEDAVTFPEDSLKEGMKTEITEDGRMGNQAAAGEEEMGSEGEMMPGEEDMGSEGEMMPGEGDMGSEGMDMSGGEVISGGDGMSEGTSDEGAMEVEP